MSDIYEKLLEVQRDLHAPKGQKNKFGNYNYRSCEDILQAVKPILANAGCTIVISDTIDSVLDRVYVTANVDFVYKGDKITVTASAREAVNKKGMDDSQITGACSSYARKYALNGLLLIDDTKDADTMDNRLPMITGANVDVLIATAKEKSWTSAQAIAKVKEKYRMTEEQELLIKEEVK